MANLVAGDEESFCLVYRTPGGAEMGGPEFKFTSIEKSTHERIVILWERQYSLVLHDYEWKEITRFYC